MTVFEENSSKRYTRGVSYLALDWRAFADAHAARADALTAPHRERRTRGAKHPIEDFLFTYYSITPAELRRWHPGAGVVLADAPEREQWKYYTVDASSTARLDLPAYFARREATVDYVDTLLRRTLERTPRYGCFGLHEWAMVYRLTPEQLRHRGLALRIGHDATDRVVETHPIGCSHFDAFRFFTPEAKPLNALQPTRETQPDLEQPGCLHAGMDIYKWCGKLGPIIPGDLLLDAFELARDIRVVDMQASPYDVRAYGYAAIPIETPEGKREYADRQRAFAQRGNTLRERALRAIGAAREAMEAAELRAVSAARSSRHHDALSAQ